MRVHRFPDAASFLAVAGDFMAAREAFHNLPIAIARQCVADPSRHSGRNWFAAVEGPEGIEGVAMMTPPHRLGIYVSPGDAVELIADTLTAEGCAVPGVHGPIRSAEAFAKRWSARRGVRIRGGRGLRAFELTTVIPAPPAVGAMRAATEADFPFVERAWRAFEEETHGASVGAMPPEELARRALREGRIFLWDDGGAVSQAALTGSTPRGRRIGAVWTPKELRRRGYATALVAALSRHVLDAGSSFVFLFTDLANAVSNSIYPKIGYRPVADYRDIDFET